METNKVVLDINDYNILYSKAVKCEQLEEENELLKLQLQCTKTELISMKVANEESKSLIVQSPKRIIAKCFKK